MIRLALTVDLALDGINSVLRINAGIRAAINDLDPTFYNQMMISP